MVTAPSRPRPQDLEGVDSGTSSVGMAEQHNQTILRSVPKIQKTPTEDDSNNYNNYGLPKKTPPVIPPQALASPLPPPAEPGDDASVGGGRAEETSELAPPTWGGTANCSDGADRTTPENGTTSDDARGKDDDDGIAYGQPQAVENVETVEVTKEVTGEVAAAVTSDLTSRKDALAGEKSSATTAATATAATTATSGGDDHQVEIDDDLGAADEEETDIDAAPSLVMEGKNGENEESAKEELGAEPQEQQQEQKAKEQEEEGEQPKLLLPLATQTVDRGILLNDDGSDGSTDDEEEASCDLSADTLPMTDGDDERVEAVAMGTGLGAGLQQRRQHQSFSVFEHPDTDEVAAVVTELLSPDSKTVHQALVDGCCHASASAVVDYDDTDDNSAAVGGRRRHSNDTASVSVDTDDGMGREISNLNSYEDETRREVEAKTTLAPSTAEKEEEEEEDDVITAAVKAGDATPTNETAEMPTRTSPADMVDPAAAQQENSGGCNTSRSTVGGAGNSALERLQQQVGAMARATLMGDDSDDNMEDDFVPLGVGEQKRISFLSDADDSMGRELSRLQEAEDETRREVEDAAISAPAAESVGGPTSCSSPAEQVVESDGPAGTIPQSMVDNDVTVEASNTTSTVAELERSSRVSPSPVFPRRVDDVPDAAAPLVSDSKLSFQECIEKERWDAVRRHLDTDHGKVSRRDVYITSNVSLEDDHDDMDYVELLDASGSGSSSRDTRYRRKATALHLACIHDPPLDVVKSLIRAHPEAVSTPTHLGWEYPLHYAVGSGMSSDEILLTLVEAYPDAVSKVSTAAGRYGPHKSPLHLAVSLFEDSDDDGPSPSVLRAMCRRNPAARRVRDGSDRTPLEVAKASRSDCSQVVMKILSPSDDTNELVRFRAKSFLAAVVVVITAVLLQKLEKAVNLFLGRAEATFTVLVSMGSDGLAVAACICIIALLIVNTTRIIQQDKTVQRSLRGQDETGHASDELVTILYVSAVGLIVLFATEPVTLLLHTTVVTGCAVGYILLRRSRQGPIDDIDAEFSDCRDYLGDGTHRSMSDSSLKDYSSTKQYDLTPLERDGMCIVCWDRPADHVLVPCGHLCLCAECPRRLGEDLNWQCPIGKCAVHAAMKVYPAQISDSADEIVATHSTTARTTTNEEEE